LRRAGAGAVTGGRRDACQPRRVPAVAETDVVSLLRPELAHPAAHAPRADDPDLHHVSAFMGGRAKGKGFGIGRPALRGLCALPLPAILYGEALASGHDFSARGTSGIRAITRRADDRVTGLRVTSGGFRRSLAPNGRQSITPFAAGTHGVCSSRSARPGRVVLPTPRAQQEAPKCPTHCIWSGPAPGRSSRAGREAPGVS